MTIPPLTMTCDEDGCAASIRVPDGLPPAESVLVDYARLKGWSCTPSGSWPSRHLCPTHNPEKVTS